MCSSECNKPKHADLAKQSLFCSKKVINLTNIMFEALAGNDMKKLILILLFLPVLAFGDEVVNWPDLRTIKYVSGRPATEADINEGSAVFLLQSEGVNIGKPIDISLPQYAYHKDVDTGDVTKVVIIQAETASGNDIYGALDISTNGFLVGTAPEFELLGEDVPK